MRVIWRYAETKLEAMRWTHSARRMRACWTSVQIVARALVMEVRDLVPSAEVVVGNRARRRGECVHAVW